MSAKLCFLAALPRQFAAIGADFGLVGFIERPEAYRALLSAFCVPDFIFSPHPDNLLLEGLFFNRKKILTYFSKLVK